MDDAEKHEKEKELFDEIELLNTASQFNELINFIFSVNKKSRIYGTSALFHVLNVSHCIREVEFLWMKSDDFKLQMENLELALKDKKFMVKDDKLKFKEKSLVDVSNVSIQAVFPLLINKHQSRLYITSGNKPWENQSFAAISFSMDYKFDKYKYL